ncbi:potassium-transporting ATPase subunit KdpA [Solidesulfovibrio magneticus]|uniref:Potassium-transporting ATPase potassium-binding subunit n=1 Tax=Solidesulfovibrio magneticus (strain ATCC 700980 / DSM 13731 / RS-1) TaxID=573370 RepID=KDPA_SOLM1|nr:potassium-transporting ATPase subunit KdpA [Solidesulfovibrio magneticus]C4XKM8.1 RecName: Full=Potassium-transporting ATPase potassium-binding subunit; AltName: Full=ATP phosphohydrolase [potassium-transporting] A chain; AltName: Full=Potassium-binding and translocating subunit A; AltName: Full=Potassium-translocating ATPase A chain [Solidesulfovibrio magneticus RS-1]BAH74419.1 potassium-transporting ATPase A chain [Solidesulfovibrio magneticus RS-1]
MNPINLVQLLFFLSVLLVLSWPLGLYAARVYQGQPCVMDKILGPLERLLYRISGVDASREMDWKIYALVMLGLNAFGMVFVYVLERLQGGLPLNPLHLPGVDPFVAVNTAVSFATNTNWQAYAGESTMSILTQMLGLAVQNFLSAATGMAVAVALIRGLARRETTHLGNFWQDLTRSVLYILLPLSFVLALLLVWQGVPQTFTGQVEADWLDPAPHVAESISPDTPSTDQPPAKQTIVLGPVASQVAIKQLGTNGGGYFNVNSAHPLENPTPLTNLLEMLAILLIPAALCHTFGVMIGDRRQGLAILAAMTILFAGFAALTLAAESVPNPTLSGIGVPAVPSLEGKEVRFGTAGSALWAAATTAASNGSVNAMHDSFSPLGGMWPMLLMQLGEVVYGGVGSGLYGMLVFAVVTVFVAGLMVGRTPEYCGKKIEPFETKMAALVILIPPFLCLAGTALAAVIGPADAVSNPGPHGFSQMLYAFSSMGNNNGSAFAGLTATSPFWTIAGAVAMFVSRYWLIVPVLALAGSLAGKKRLAQGPGTLPTHGGIFVALLIIVVLVVGALTFVPALALGPIAEQLALFQ